MTSARILLVMCLALAVSERLDGAHDLDLEYAGALEPAPHGYAAGVTDRDVWSLTSFAFETPGGFALDLGPSTLAVGHLDGAALWAAVTPHVPGRLTLPSGTASPVTSVWLRLHPSTIGTLAPPATVRGRVEDDAARTFAMIDARRLAAHKMRSSFHVNGRPMMPPIGTTIIDCEITPAARRFFVVAGEPPVAKHHAFFDTRPLPPATPIPPEVAARIFDESWATFDREYACFGLRPNVDWDRLRVEYRPLAVSATTAARAAAVVAMLLAPLRDGHASVSVAGSYLPGGYESGALNANPRLLPQLIGPLHETGTSLTWSITTEDVGYVNIHGLSDRGLVTTFDEVLGTLRETRGLVIDLRFNGGGNEMIGQKIAGRFLAEDRRYSASRWRAGPARDDLGPLLWRECPTRGPWRYTAPVAVLIGPRTFSSAESFALMLAEAPNVTLYGAATAGSSGNPRVLEFPGAVAVAVPRWMDVRPDGEPLDGNGAEPDVPVAFEPTAGTDAVLSKAMDALKGARR